MCTIAIRINGNILSDETIRTIFENNPDGAGFMYPRNGKVHFEKGFFKVEDLLNAWHKIPSDCTAILHCRIKTHGEVNAKLCHPFALCDDDTMFQQSGDVECAMMHNGVISFMGKSQFYHKKYDSDSSAFAREVYLMYGSKLPQGESLELIRESTASNRLVFLDGKGNFVTSGEWEYKDGCLYSNGNWKPIPKYTYSSFYNKPYYSNWLYDDEYKPVNKDLTDEQIAFGLGLGYPDMYGTVVDSYGKTVTNTAGLWSDGYDIFWIDKNGREHCSQFYSLIPFEEEEEYASQAAN